MAGINDLVKGAVGTLAKDKVSLYLSPAQMDFLTFALNPQAYLLDKGVTAAADALGYGSQYRELKGGAQDEKDYYKEIMRDTIGDVLPGSLGDFVRATPRNTDVDNTPAGTYTAWNPDTQSFEEQQSSAPAATFDQFAGDRFASGFDVTSPFNVASDTYVGPQEKDSMQSIQGRIDLLDILDQYRAPEVPEMVTTGTKEPTPDGSTYVDDLGAYIPTPSGAGGDFMPSGGGKFDEYFQDYYKHGGQIHRGKR